jgi:hypothetical protein
MRFELSSQGARGFVLRADRGDPDVAADADDDGIVDLADALLVLDHSLGRPLAGVAPLGLCGLDRTDDDALSCRGQEICSGGNVRPRAVRVGLLPAADNVIASDSLDPSFAARVRADTALAVGSNFGADAYGHRIEHHNRTALAFELGRLHGLRVRRAFLRLRVRTPADVSGVEYAAHPLAGPWSPRTLTFENAPPFLTTAEARAVAPARTGAAMVFDVTEMVRRWVAGDLRNHGLLVRELVDERPAGEAMENRTTVFDSVDRYLGDDTRPRLFVELY